MFRNVITKINLHKVVAGHALILTAAKGVQILTIQRSQNWCDILTIVVPRLSNRLWWPNSRNREFDRGNIVPFVGEDLCACRVVYSHERERIVKKGLPKPPGPTQVIEATRGFNSSRPILYHSSV